MKKLMQVFCLVLLGSVALAQQAALQTPVPRTSEAKYVVQEFSVSQTQAMVTIQVRDAAEATIRTFDVIDTDATAFLTAMDTVRATETGGVLRRMNFRILGRLADAGRISGVTLVP